LNHFHTSCYNKDESNCRKLQGQGIKYFPNHLNLPNSFRNRAKVASSSSAAPPLEDSGEESEGEDDGRDKEEEEEEEGDDDFMLGEDEEGEQGNELYDDSEDNLFAPTIRIDKPPPV
jgi:hypothetical protein